jgi:hypothetical protein
VKGRERHLEAETDEQEQQRERDERVRGEVRQARRAE